MDGELATVGLILPVHTATNCKHAKSIVHRPDGPSFGHIEGEQMNLNKSLLKALTWGTFAAAVMSAMLLAALEPAWLDVTEVVSAESTGLLPPPTGADPRQGAESGETRASQAAPGTGSR